MLIFKSKSKWSIILLKNNNIHKIIKTDIN